MWSKAETGGLEVLRFQAVEKRLFRAYDLDLEERFLDMPALGIRARALGMGTGRPLLFIHGGGGVSSQWAPLLAEVRDSSRTLIAVDRPGCGLSGAFDYRGVDLRKHAITFIDAILDQLGFGEVDIVGNSLGGLWALWYAHDRPERVGRIVQLSCPALILGSGAPMRMRIATLPVVNRFSPMLKPATRESVLAWFSAMGEAGMPDELIEIKLASMRLPWYWRGWYTMLKTLMTLRGVRPHLRLEADELSEIPHPTLFIWGRHDPFGGEPIARQATSLMPNGELRLIEAAHMPWMKEPGLAGNVLREYLRSIREERPLASMAHAAGVR